jgi:hypothetical protein
LTRANADQIALRTLLCDEVLSIPALTNTPIALNNVIIVHLSALPASLSSQSPHS